MVIVNIIYMLLLLSQAFQTQTTGENEYRHERKQPQQRYHLLEEATRGVKGREGMNDGIIGDDAYVSLPLGKLRGKRRVGPIERGDPTSELLRLVDWYLGVPYASPPTSNLRFQKTEPPQPWVGTRDATKFQASCPQRFVGSRFEDEDCLYLNVYAPVKPGNASSSPVMMYIHGGSYLEGSGNLFIGDTLAQHGVVVVTINYRLGVLGFLSSRTTELEGNWGLYDQIEALKWIQTNIKFFGGDPRRVTIFGNSAGGASVGILAASPVTKGLLRRAIMQSGSPLSFWAVHSNMSVDYERYARNLARKCGCGQNKMEEVVHCLRRVDFKKLDIRILQGDGLETLKPTNHDLLPILDDVIIPSDFFQSPLKFHVDSFMSGVAANEWSRHIFLYFEIYADAFGLTDNALENLCCDLNMEKFEENIKYVMKELHGYGDLAADLAIYRYTNFTALNDIEEIRQQYMNFAADMAFIVPSLNYASRASVSGGGVPTYFYVFNHKRSSEQFKSWQQNYHEIELTYIFGHPFRGDEPYSDSHIDYSLEDKEVSLHIMKLWSNFAKNGDPNDKVGQKEDGNIWQTFNSSKLNYYSIDLPGSSTMKSHLRSEYVAFWNHIIPQAITNSHNNSGNSCLNIALISVLLSTILLFLCGSMVWILLKKFKHFKARDNKNEPTVIYKKNSQS